MNKWKLLAEAEYWEHLAQLELSSYFEECNAVGSTSSHDLAGNETTLKSTSCPDEAARDRWR